MVKKEAKPRRRTASQKWSQKLQGATALLLVCAATSASANSGLMEQGLSLADASEPQVIAWRRHIHEHPELPWQEKETAKYVPAALSKMPGFQVQTGIAGTGIKAVLRGGKPGPVIALRADMDALPVQERNDLPFKSTTKGVYNGRDTYVAHVCGHDTHVAMLLGAAQAFSKIQKDLPGTVVLIFQPAEEAGPGNGGAEKMIAAGVLDKPKVDVILGQHINGRGPSGTISYRAGDFMAGANNFTIKLNGKGGHGSQPWAANDPIIATAELVLSLQGIISHQINQQRGYTTLTIGMVQSGNKTNILPETAEVAGTIRSLSKDNLTTARESLLKRVKGIADTWNLKSDVKVGSGGYDNVVNDQAMVKTILPAFQLAAGSDKVIDTEPIMGGDDFGAFGATGIPAVYWFLNASPNGAKDGAPNHSPEFRIDESALKVGVRALVATTLQTMAASQK